MNGHESPPSPTATTSAQSWHDEAATCVPSPAETPRSTTYPTDSSTEKQTKVHTDEVDGPLTVTTSHLSGVAATQLEMLLHSSVRQHGHPAHVGAGKGEEGVLEERMTVDLGNGPEEAVIVEWRKDDPECPYNWSSTRKAATTLAVCYLTSLTAVNATSTGVMAEWGIPWFNTTHEGYIVGGFCYLFAVAITPLVLAPMSELFGRNVIYHVTSTINALLFIPPIFSHSYSGLLAARWFQGMVSSVGNSMVGGSIADIYRAADRGPMMNVFAIFIFAGQAFGGVCFGWIGMKLGIRWCYGIQGIAAALSCLVNFAVLRETRSDVILARRAARLTKETGQKHVTAAELQKKSLKQLFIVALRPLQYLCTEPIVTAMSLWVGFAWGCVFLGTSSVLLVFGQYGWNSGLRGTAEICTLIGGILGFISNYHAEYLYARAAARAPDGRAAPEVRLYWAATGGLLFPLCMFGFAWTGQPHIHWAVPAVFLCLSYWGIYIMYSSVFNYLADAYETYSSSAQAAQSFSRNVFSSIFPLFATAMYTHLGYPVASTVAASIGLVLAAAPIALVFYGKKLRQKSKVASAIWASESEGK